MAQQHNSAGGRERKQRCWATRITGVPDIFSPGKNFTYPVNFILVVGGGYLWHLATLVSVKFRSRVQLCIVLFQLCDAENSNAGEK